MDTEPTLLHPAAELKDRLLHGWPVLSSQILGTLRVRGTLVPQRDATGLFHGPLDGGNLLLMSEPIDTSAVRLGEWCHYSGPIRSTIHGHIRRTKMMVQIRRVWTEEDGRRMIRVER